VDRREVHATMQSTSRLACLVFCAFGRCSPLECGRKGERLSLLVSQTSVAPSATDLREVGESKKTSVCDHVYSYAAAADDLLDPFSLSISGCVLDMVGSSSIVQVCRNSWIRSIHFVFHWLASKENGGNRMLELHLTFPCLLRTGSWSPSFSYFRFAMLESCLFQSCRRCI
jgi:hypothetical protein